MSDDKTNLLQAYRELLKSHWINTELIELITQHKDDDGAVGEITNIGRHVLYETLEQNISRQFELIDTFGRETGIVSH